MKYFWCALVLFMVQISDDMALEGECRFCRVYRVHKMKAVDCYKKEFKIFPKCLTTDAEVLDLSFNRIRKVSKNELSRFSNLKVLYLNDNLLVKLDENTFEDLTDLTTLDLSMNALSKLPSGVFQLPSLKSLYFSQNWNINIIEAVEKSKPISSTLTQIDMSFTTDEDNISKFPDFGPMPYLAGLNITGNKYSSITPRSIFGLCKLKILASANVTIEYNDPCDCWIINNWLQKRGVLYTQFMCPVTKTYCSAMNADFKSEDLKVFDECIQMIETIETHNKIYKVSMGVGITAVTLLALMLGILIYKKKKNQKKFRTNPDLPKSLELLNNRTKSEPNEYTL